MREIMCFIPSHGKRNTDKYVSVIQRLEKAHHRMVFRIQASSLNLTKPFQLPTATTLNKNAISAHCIG
jgi:hypothetical protein